MGRYTDDDGPSELADPASEYEGYESDDEDSDEGTEDQDAEDAGEGPEGEQDDEAPDAAEVDTDEDDGPSFEVTLPGGEKTTVSLSELVAGYSRTADYTRKTQTLAAERRNLADAAAMQAALERNPEAAIAALARAYKVAPPGAQDDDSEDVYVSDEDRWRQQVDARFQAQDRQQREAAIDREVQRLHAQYGDFDEETLFTHAVQTGTMNLEIALQALQYQGLAERQSQRTQRSGENREKKRAATSVRGAGRSGNGSVPVVEENEIVTFKDAYEYAKRVRENQRS